MGDKKGLQTEDLAIKTERVIIDRCLEPETRLILKRNQSAKILLLPERTHPHKILEVYLDGEGSRAEVLGIVLGKEKEETDLTVRVIHRGTSTWANTHVRGVLFSESRTFFKGLIRIEKGANKTSSILTNRVLILGENGRADSVPSLEIEADDVKASHAATVGRIDEKQLFYLQSRGIDRKTSVRMIADGFFDPVLSKIGDGKTIAAIRGNLWVDILRN